MGAYDSAGDENVIRLQVPVGKRTFEHVSMFVSDLRMDVSQGGGKLVQLRVKFSAILSAIVFDVNTDEPSVI